MTSSLPVLQPGQAEAHAAEGVGANLEGFPVVFVVLLDGDLVMSPEHLGVALMTAVLRRAGCPVTIVDVEHGRDEQALAEIVGANPKLVGFTLMQLNVPSWLGLSAKVKAALPTVPQVCGGPAVTFSRGEILTQNPCTDIGVVGEGEVTVLDLVGRLATGKGLDGCEGVCFRNEQGILQRNRLRAPISDLDSVPFAVRDQLERHRRKMPYVRVSTSRGCVGQCAFCCAPNAANRVQGAKVWRGRSARSIGEELTKLVTTYRFRTYDFVDSSFEDPGGPVGKSRIADIARELIDRNLNIYYNCCLRAEDWTDDDDELLDLLVQSGLEKVNVGIESGTQWELEMWQKRATVADNERIIRLLQKHGVYLAMGFIPFHPYATMESLKNNAEFLRRNYGHNLRRLTERLEICPGMPIVDRLYEDGLMPGRAGDEFGHYDYGYRDERVGWLARYFASLYNNADYQRSGVITKESAVFKFETFNVVVATFWSRIYRRFRRLPGVMEELEALRAGTQVQRQQVANFNNEFFLRVVEDVMADRREKQAWSEQLGQVESILGNAMDQIRTLQLRAGRRMERLGVNLREISSVYAESAPHVQNPEFLARQRDVAVR
jgi:radical SAM superfamily enzyme YgiQ (UPF0313 family)